MKTKLYLLTIILCSFFTPRLQAGNAFYVYQNTGAIDAFFTYEVDSIRYSNFDLDSVWHTTSQVQEIWTRDSIYRIPLENIDSVSFITPETVYKDDVINISDNLMDYLIRCDSMTLFFRENTPSDILPKKGDKIADEDIEKLYIGACLKMGIGPVEDLSELFQVLFGLGEEKKDDKPLQYYA